MADKVPGKLAAFTLGGSPINFESYSMGFDAQVVLYPNKTSGIKEPVAGREKRTLSLSGKLLNGSSKSFIAKQLKLTFNSVDYPLISASYDSNHDELDGTDGGTADNGSEATAGLKECKVTMELFITDTINEKTAFAIGTPQTATLLWDTGISVAGSLTPTSIKPSGGVDGNNKYTLEGNFSTMTETGVGETTGGDAAAAVITLKDGTTDKAYAGNVVLLSKSISGGVSQEMQFTYNFVINGTLTPTVYS